MKKQMITMFALLALIFSFSALPNVLAENETLVNETEDFVNETEEITSETIVNETINNSEEQSLEDIFEENENFTQDNLSQEINETDIKLPGEFSRFFSKVGDFFASEEEKAQRALERVQENKIRILKRMMEKQSGLANSQKFAQEMEKLEKYIQEDMATLEKVIEIEDEDESEENLNKISKIKNKVMTQSRIDNLIQRELNETIRNSADLSSEELATLKKVQENSRKIVEKVEKRLKEKELNLAARMISNGYSIEKIKEIREEAREKLEERKEEAKEKLQERKEELQEKAQERKEKLEERKEEAKEKLQERKEELQEKAQERREELEERREEAREKLQERLRNESEHEEQEIEIEVEIKNVYSKIEYEIGNLEEDFMMNTTNEEEILNEISKRTNLTIEEIKPCLKIEYDLDDEEENDDESESEDFDEGNINRTYNANNSIA